MAAQKKYKYGQMAPINPEVLARLQAQNPTGYVNTVQNPVSGKSSQAFYVPPGPQEMPVRGPSYGGGGFGGPITTQPVGSANPMPGTGGGHPTEGAPSGGTGSGPSGSYTGGPMPTMKSAGLPGAGEGVINSFNTAANRLRERIDASTRGDIDSATRFNLGRGFGNSGLQDRAVRSAQASGKFAYSQGLSDLANKFEDQRLRGVDMDRQNANFQDQTLFNLLNNREGRQSDWDIASMNARNQQQLAKMGYRFQGGQNDMNRELERMLEELRQQNQNYRDASGMGQNQYPSILPGASVSGRVY